MLARSAAPLINFQQDFLVRQKLATAGFILPGQFGHLGSYLENAHYVSVDNGLELAQQFLAWWVYDQIIGRQHEAIHHVVNAPLEVIRLGCFQIVQRRGYARFVVMTFKDLDQFVE